MKQLVFTTVMKFAAFFLTIGAAAYMISCWSLINGLNNPFVEILTKMVIPTIDPAGFSILALYLGFAVLWILLILENVVKKDPLVFLLFTIFVSMGFSSMIVAKGTVEGWLVMAYVNSFSFIVNGLFAIAYLTVGKVWPK